MLVSLSVEFPGAFQVMNLTSLHTSPEGIHFIVARSLADSFIYVGYTIEVTHKEPRAYNVILDAIKLTKEKILSLAP